MTDAQTLLSAVIRAGEGTRKTGYETQTVLGVTYSISGTGDTVTFSGQIPITPGVNATGSLIIEAKDFITFAAVTP